MKRQIAAHDPLHQVNGVKLHYLDWDGKGEVLLSLPGLSCTARIFDGLAPKFTDHFRVLALTRRGFGQSDKRLPSIDGVLFGSLY